MFIEASDYQDIGVKTLVLNSSITNYTINIPIKDDAIFELTEEVQAKLKFAQISPLNVMIMPSEAIITILDDDSKP